MCLGVGTRPKTLVRSVGTGRGLAVFSLSILTLDSHCRFSLSQGEGEDIGSEDDMELDDAEDADADADDWMVPDGYLSDEDATAALPSQYPRQQVQLTCNLSGRNKEAELTLMGIFPVVALVRPFPLRTEADDSAAEPAKPLKKAVGTANKRVQMSAADELALAMLVHGSREVRAPGASCALVRRQRFCRAHKGSLPRPCR